jgi:hypothetical protein
MRIRVRISHFLFAARILALLMRSLSFLYIVPSKSKPPCVQLEKPKAGAFWTQDGF